jgi:hypothetical protein
VPGDAAADVGPQHDLRRQEQEVAVPGVARVVPERQGGGVLAGDDPEPVVGQVPHDGVGPGVELPQREDGRGEEEPGGLEPAIVAELAAGGAAGPRQEGDDGLGGVGDGGRGGGVVVAEDVAGRCSAGVGHGDGTPMT